MSLANTVGYDFDQGIATVGDTLNFVLDADESSAGTVDLSLWSNDPVTGTRFFQVTYDGTTTAITTATTFSAAGTALTVTNNLRCAGLGINAAPSGTAGDIAGTVRATGTWTWNANVTQTMGGSLNVGTTILATAQGALAAGITGGRQCYFNPATSILGVYDSTGIQRIWNDADNIAAGIGAAPGGYRMFALEETGNGDGGSWYGIETLLTANANITVGMHVWRLRAIASGSPTIADVTGARIDLSGLGTATVTTAHAIHILDWTVGTTKIAVHQVGTNAHSRFQGGATFGADATTTSGFVLDAVGAIRFTSAPRADYALTAADANLPTFINTPTGIPAIQKGWRRINGVGGAQEYVPVWGL